MNECVPLAADQAGVGLWVGARADSGAQKTRADKV
jgi:hypothetical protein